MKKNKEKKAGRIVVAVVSVIALIGIFTYFVSQEKSNLGTEVLLETTLGEITIQLYEDMPVTSGNFENLVSSGFYDGIIFHRVIDGFIIQGGDPTGTGRGGPGYEIQDEFSDNPQTNRNDRGTISMANAGPNTGGSQFFINLQDNNFLDGKHPVFGVIVSGMDVVDKIGRVKTDSGKPIEEVRILTASIN